MDQTHSISKDLAGKDLADKNLTDENLADTGLVDKNFTSNNLESPKLRSIARTLIPMFLILCIGLITIVKLLSYSTSAHDQAMRQDLSSWMDIALRIEATEIKQFAVDYSFWDDAYNNLIVTPNKQWANDEIGEYLTNHFGTDLTFSVNADGETTVVFVGGKESSIDLPRLLNDGVREALSIDWSTASADKAVSFFLINEGILYLAAVNHMVADYSKETFDGSYLLLAHRVDNSYLEILADKYEIHGLRMVDSEEASSELKKTVVDINQKPIAQFMWDDPASGSEGGKKLTWAVSIVMLVMSLLTVGMVVGELSRRHRINALLLEQSLMDSLTGIGNRRFFFERGGDEINRFHRSKRSLYLMMLDIDNFKSINDTYGHKAGDLVLVELAKMLKRRIRGFDFLARIGGEEFAIVLPDATEVEAKVMADRILEAVANLHESGADICCPVTTSIGLAHLYPEDSLPDLMNRADRALYVAKNSGRNRCVVDDSRLKVAKLDVA